MKTKTSILVIAAALFTTPAATTRLVAQEQNPKHHHYKLIDVGTFGGPNSVFTLPLVPINSRGKATSCADTSALNPNYPNINAIWSGAKYAQHAFLWDGQLNDLGTLPGGISSCGQSINRGGQIIGYSENGESDPLLGSPAVHAAFWNHGQITDLGTFGGYESVGYSINERGMAVGGASNSIPDPYTSNYNNFAVQAATEVHGFLWDNGTLQDLGTLGTGNDSVAFYVNKRGQVAGQSFTDTTVNLTTGMPTLHPFLWENGTMKDLGTLGGTTVVFLSALNEKGQVAGVMTEAGEATSHAFFWDGHKMNDIPTFGGPNSFAWGANDAGEVVGGANNFPGDIFTQHAFSWRHGVMTDLQTLPGDGASQANAINANGQKVGTSYPPQGTSHAVLWEKDGPIVKLQDLIVGGTNLTLWEAVFISDEGEIAVNALTPSGDNRGVLLVPCEDEESCSDDAAGADAAPEHTVVRELFGQMVPASLGRRTTRNRLGLTTGPRNELP